MQEYVYMKASSCSFSFCIFFPHSMYFVYEISFLWELRMIGLMDHIRPLNFTGEWAFKNVYLDFEHWLVEGPGTG